MILKVISCQNWGKKFKNFQIPAFGVILLPKEIIFVPDFWFKIQIWLNLPGVNRHFGYRQKFLKKKTLVGTWGSGGNSRGTGSVTRVNSGPVSHVERWRVRSVIYMETSQLPSPARSTITPFFPSLPPSLACSTACTHARTTATTILSVLRFLLLRAAATKIAAKGWASSSVVGAAEAAAGGYEYAEDFFPPKDWLCYCQQSTFKLFVWSSSLESICRRSSDPSFSTLLPVLVQVLFFSFLLSASFLRLIQPIDLSFCVSCFRPIPAVYVARGTQVYLNACFGPQSSWSGKILPSR